MTKSRSLLGWSLGLALAAGCGKSPTGPVAGEFTVSFSSGANSDGALLLLITGPVNSVQVLNGYQMSSAAAGTNRTRVVITGDLIAGDVLKLSVPDTSTALGAYSATVEAAANRTTYALADPALYTATVRK
jgi:hypothetical protein